MAAVAPFERTEAHGRRRICRPIRTDDEGRLIRRLMGHFCPNRVQVNWLKTFSEDVIGRRLVHLTDDGRQLVTKVVAKKGLMKAAEG
jgi:hypothetical protein